MSNINWKKLLTHGYLYLLLIVIYAPILIIIIYSFTESKVLGNWTGFSFGWAAQLYAMTLNGNAAYEKLRAFAIGFVADNGFHLNGDFKNYGFSRFKYRPFTLESLYAFCDAIQEMLLQIDI